MLVEDHWLVGAVVLDKAELLLKARSHAQTTITGYIPMVMGTLAGVNLPRRFLHVPEIQGIAYR